MGWNPSAPATLGIEWAPHVESVVPLTTTTDCLAWLVRSTVAETISGVYLPHTWTGPSSGWGKLVVDVYNLSDTGAGSPPTETRYSPNEDKAIGNLYAPVPGTWGSTLSLGNGYTKIDDGASPGDSDWLAFPGGSLLRMAFGTSGFTGRPSAVSFDVRAFGYAGQNGKLDVELYNGTTRVSKLGTITPPADGADWPSGLRTYRLGPFTTNPLTGLPWTQADIVSFDTGTNLLIQLTGPTSSTAVSWLSMIVASGSDKRVATGSTTVQTAPPAGPQTGLVASFASNWSKASATDYLLVARRLNPTSSAQPLIPQPVYLDGRTACPHGQGAVQSATIDASGLVADVGTPHPTRTVPFWLARTDGAASADSQPYWDIDALPVYTGNGTFQDLVGASTGIAYKLVTALVAIDPANPPAANVVVKLKRTSDNVQLGGDGTLTVANLAAGVDLGVATLAGRTVALYRVQVMLAASATLAAATEYYLEWTSSTSSSAPWYTVWADGTASHSLTGDVTYGGTGVVAWSTPAVSHERATFLQTLSGVPSAPSSITVTKTTTTINGATVDYAAVSWVSGGSLGASFARWEVERSEDGGTTWSPIATVSTEATIAFSDYQSARGVAVKYRVRVVRADGVPSDWTTQSGTITPAAYPGSWALFTSNGDPAVTVGFTPDGIGWTAEFLSAEETTFVALHDEDYQAAFRPLEERGARWKWKLQVHTAATAPAVGHGIRVFDALRSAARARGTLCLHTADGERFFGALQVWTGDRDFATGAYFAEVTFTETTGTASTVAL